MYNKGDLITTGLEGQQYSTFGITDKVYGKVGVGLEAGAVVSIENKKVETGYARLGLGNNKLGCVK